jgi:flagellar hook-associated protein 3 FlgL
MAIRVTQNTMTNQFQSDISSIYARMARAQQQVSDGRAITKPSDDPYGAARVMDFDAQISQSKQNQSTISDTIGFLDSADSALDNVTGALQAIRALAVKAADGSNNAVDKQGIAREIQELKEVVRDGLNARHGAVFLFSGTAGTTQPFPPGANAYAGTSTAMSRLVSPSQIVTMSVPGDTLAGPNGANVLDDIDALILDVQSGSSQAVHNNIGQLDTVIGRAIDVRTGIGATTTRLETMYDRLTGVEERLTAARSEIANVDAAEAFMNFSQEQTMYQAALAAGTRIMQTSILDYL